jgi:hypothetical protein
MSKSIEYVGRVLVAMPLKKTPEIVNAIEHIMKHDIAGDPISGLRWTRKTRSKVARQLAQSGIDVGTTTVGKLLRGMHFSLRVNRKKLGSGNATPQQRRERNRQFGYIRKVRNEFTSSKLPIVSVDTKKKETIGNFKNSGATWETESRAVNDHDFVSSADGKGIPRGIYDVSKNTGFVSVGVSHDTPEFAVDAIDSWWKCQGSRDYKKAKRLLILADSGGSNSARSKMWKYYLKTKIVDQYGMSVTVCHYPTGASKWNPIEHRLFGPISKNWEGIPLRSLETVLKYIRTTVTKTGLKVQAILNRKKYATKQKLTRKQEQELIIKYHSVLPKWNYTIDPKTAK